MRKQVINVSSEWSEKLLPTTGHRKSSCFLFKKGSLHVHQCNCAEFSR